MAKKNEGKVKKSSFAVKWKGRKTDPRLDYRGLPNGDKD